MNRQDPITDRARELFERASNGLDQGAAFRLRRARHEALQPPRPARTPRFAPAAAFGAAVLALGLAWWWPGAGPAPAPAVASEPATTAEIDALVVDEDLDLYAWLAEAPVATASGENGL